MAGLDPLQVSSSYSNSPGAVDTEMHSAISSLFLQQHIQQLRQFGFLISITAVLAILRQLRQLLGSQVGGDILGKINCLLRRRQFPGCVGAANEWPPLPFQVVTRL